MKGFGICYKGKNIALSRANLKFIYKDIVSLFLVVGMLSASLSLWLMSLKTLAFPSYLGTLGRFGCIGLTQTELCMKNRLPGV